MILAKGAIKQVTEQGLQTSNYILQVGIKLLGNAAYLNKTNNAKLIRPTGISQQINSGQKEGHCHFKYCLGIRGKANEECQLGLFY